MKDFHEKLEKAHQASKRGFAYLHVFSPCTTGWRYPGDKTLEVQRRAVETNVFPLWEYEKQTGKLRFTHSVEEPEPIENYIGMLGKFRHLGKEEVARLKKAADDRVRILKAIEQSGTEAVTNINVAS
jgi:phenylglyoxylate dehydrogenase beta subunit